MGDFIKRRDVSVGPVLTALRAATRAAHDRLERRADPRAHLGTRGGRASLVGRYYSLHVPAEHQLAPWLSDMPALGFSERRRTPILLEALKELALPPPSAAPPPLSPMHGRAEALGFFYVLEGASLGGRVILRDLTRRGVDPAGLAFLDPYGPAAGERWSAFIRVLEREGSDGLDMPSLVGGALNGFAYAEACLAGTAIAA
jgi:heme oxygenase